MEFAKGNDEGSERLFDFNRFVRYPREWREIDAAFSAWWESGPDLSTEPPVSAYSEWGHTWCRDNWGTNSNAVGVSYGETTAHGGTSTATVYFETAWSEPGPVILRASQLFPDLGFEMHYFEPLGDFAGCYRCAAGVGADEKWPCDHSDEK